MLPERSIEPKILLDKMAPTSIFARHSSPVDWCEPNYVHSPFIAEFFNTVSNVLFFVYPPLLAVLCSQRSRRMAMGSGLVWLMLVVIGSGSVYFHSTLTMLGQLIDEMAILWVVMAAIGTWTPQRILPICIKQNMGNFRLFLFVFCVVCASISWMHPSINAFALMTLCVPAIGLMIDLTYKTSSERARKLGRRLLIQMMLALTCWVTDKLHCSFWLSVGFPYFHALWHVLIALTACQACVMYAFYDACNEASHLGPSIAFWPRDDWEYVGVPYLTLRDLPS